MVAEKRKVRLSLGITFKILSTWKKRYVTLIYLEHSTSNKTTYMIEYINNKSTTFPFYYGMYLHSPAHYNNEKIATCGKATCCQSACLNYSHTLNQLHVSLT